MNTEDVKIGDKLYCFIDFSTALGKCLLFDKGCIIEIINGDNNESGNYYEIKMIKGDRLRYNNYIKTEEVMYFEPRMERVRNIAKHFIND